MDGASSDPQILKGPLIGIGIVSVIIVFRHFLIILIFHELGNLLLILVYDFALPSTA